MINPDELRPSFDAWALGVAHAVGQGADCSRRKIGAVIIDTQKRVVSTGYNGSPPGEPGCLSDGACPRARLSATEMPHGSGDYSECIAVHAEANAIIWADPSRLVGATIYISADAPCQGCLKLIRGAGIKHVVTTTTCIQQYRS